MNINVENLEKNVKKLEITVPAETFESNLKKSFKKNAKKFDVPGFRKGKAPMHIVIKYYGEGALFEDAVNFCIDETYPKAIEQEGIEPVDYPKIDITKVERGSEFVYTAEVTVVPEVKLGEYKGLGVEKVEKTVSEEDIEKNLTNLQEKNSRIEKKDGAVENNDIAVIDFKGYIDGEAFEGGEGKDFELTIGSGSFIGNFEEQLIGVNAGEEKEVVVTFPENYGVEELNGKEAKFEVKVSEVKAKELPEINDELIKDTTEFETVEEYKNDVKTKMEEVNARTAKQEFETALIDAAVANAEVEVPAVMVDREVDKKVQDLAYRLQAQGMDLATYYQLANTSEEAVKDMMKESAEKQVKVNLVLDAIAKVEGFEVTAEEVREKANEVAAQFGGDQEKLKETVDMLVNMQGELLESDIRSEKVINTLVENN